MQAAAAPHCRSPLHSPCRAVLSCVWLAKRTCNRGIDTWAIAMTLYNRFYARKSMKKNHTFVSGGEGRSRVAGGC